MAPISVPSFLLLLQTALLFLGSVHPERLIPVETAEEFRDALRASIPGDRIILPLQPIAGEFYVEGRNGTEAEPIAVVGSGTESGIRTAYQNNYYSYCLQLVECNYFHLANFSVSGCTTEVALHPYRLGSSNHLIENVSLPSVHVKGFAISGANSVNNTIRDSRVHLPFNFQTAAAIYLSNAGHTQVLYNSISVGTNSYSGTIGVDVTDSAGRPESAYGHTILGNAFHGLNGTRTFQHFVWLNSPNHLVVSNWGNFSSGHGFYVANSGPRGKNVTLQRNYCILRSSLSYCIFVQRPDAELRPNWIYSSNEFEGGRNLTNYTPVLDTVN